jgi:hypothetical protein
VVVGTGGEEEFGSGFSAGGLWLFLCALDLFFWGTPRFPEGAAGRGVMDVEEEGTAVAAAELGAEGAEDDELMR